MSDAQVYAICGLLTRCEALAELDEADTT